MGKKNKNKKNAPKKTVSKKKSTEEVKSSSPTDDNEPSSFASLRIDDEPSSLETPRTTSLLSAIPPSMPMPQASPSILKKPKPKPEQHVSPITMQPYKSKGTDYFFWFNFQLSREHTTDLVTRRWFLKKCHSFWLDHFFRVWPEKRN